MAPLYLGWHLGQLILLDEHKSTSITNASEAGSATRMVLADELSQEVSWDILNTVSWSKLAARVRWADYNTGKFVARNGRLLQSGNIRIADRGNLAGVEGYGKDIDQVHSLFGGDIFRGPRIPLYGPLVVIALSDAACEGQRI